MREIMTCRLCGRRVEVYVHDDEIVDVGRVLVEGVCGCPHKYE